MNHVNSAFANYVAATLSVSAWLLMCGTVRCAAFAVGVASMRAGTDHGRTAGARTHPHTQTHTHIEIHSL